MNEMVLLGAGASVGAGVPSSYPMTQRITARFAERDVLAQYCHVLYFVIGGLLLQKGIRGESPFDGVDVEELFSAVILLGERHSLEAAPFVGSWHNMVEQFDKAVPNLWSAGRLHELIYRSVTQGIINSLPRQAPAFAGHDIDRELAQLLQAAARNKGATSTSFISLGRKVGDYVSKFMNNWLGNLRTRLPHAPPGFGTQFDRVVKDTSRSGGGRVYRDTASLMIRMLVEIVWIDSPDKVEYLTPLLNLLAQQKRLPIATLNYDNGIELVAESRNLACNTGIDHWSATGRFDTNRDGLNLIKLHGSIDWAVTEVDPPIPDRIPRAAVVRVQPSEIKNRRFPPAVVFGQRNKLTAEGPFLDLLLAFRRELEHADRLTVVGYSFRDAHVNEYLAQWFNADALRRLRIVDPGFQSNAQTFAVVLRRHCQSRLEVVPEPAQTALPRLFPAS